MDNKNNSHEENSINKQAKVFNVISTIFFTLAFIFLIIGIFNLIFAGFSQIGHISEDVFDENFAYEFQTGLTIQSFFSWFFKAFIFFVLGMIFKSIGKSVANRNTSEKVSGTINSAINKVADSINKKLNENLNEQNDTHECKHKKIRVFCAYCGSELDFDDKKCPYCGASKKIQKKDNIQ